jgi:hypothetical protein
MISKKSMTIELEEPLFTIDTFFNGHIFKLHFLKVTKIQSFFIFLSDGEKKRKLSAICIYLWKKNENTFDFQ